MKYLKNQSMECIFLSADEDHDILQIQHADVSYIHEQVMLSRHLEEDHDVPWVSWLVDALSPVSNMGLCQG